HYIIRHVKYVKKGYKLMKRVRKTIRMPEWLTNQLVKIADFNGISVNALITNACLEMVKDFQLIFWR
ncbi:hypothetical protein, partial [Limosilactobacillus reuteri]|uniref:hypothetical protein n=2 Tax=Limosilactobacillus reuteri TaxID=1598 RepID=UPI00396A5007